MAEPLIAAAALWKTRYNSKPLPVNLRTTMQFLSDARRKQAKFSKTLSIPKPQSDPTRTVEAAESEYSELLKIRKIGFSRRQKHTKRSNRAQLERVWERGFSFSNVQVRKSAHRKKLRNA